jgi:hypothetical protein
MITANDAIALSVLVLFGFLAVMGWLKWVFRIAAGLAVGCVALIAVGAAERVPGVGYAGRFLNDGQITPALTHAAEPAMQRLGIPTGVPAETAPPEIVDAPTFAGPPDTADRPVGPFAKDWPAE